jgi:hypothetical protein
MRKGLIMEQQTKDLSRYQLLLYIKKVAQTHIIIYKERTVSGKPTLVLVDLGSTHNLMSITFAAILGLPLGTMDPCRILILNGQIQYTNLYLEDVPIQFQV